MLPLLDDSDDARLAGVEKDNTDDRDTAVFDDDGDGGERYGNWSFSSTSYAALSTADADTRLFFLSRLGIVGLESDQQCCLLLLRHR
jgi:hypothetical protein